MMRDYAALIAKLKIAFGVKAVIALLLIILFSGFIGPKVKQANEVPPGTVRIADNLYIDKGEMTNVGYREFLAWTRHVYGKESKQYQNMLPVNVWKQYNTAYAVYDTVYLNHIAYENYPVVGISYEQAIAYSSWRSDRVFEKYLVDNYVITYNEHQTPDSVFTIHRYFSGQYCGIKPSRRFRSYPVYALPTAEDYAKAKLFADSLNTAILKVCPKKGCPELALCGCNGIERTKTTNAPALNAAEPLYPTSCATCKKTVITHLQGNVREMTNINTRVYGCSFADSCSVCSHKIWTDTSAPNCFTGFRNVCSYQVWP